MGLPVRFRIAKRDQQEPDVYVCNFEEFCQACDGDAIKALLSFSENNVYWEEPEGIGLGVNRKPVRWPDDIIKFRCGNCVDFALFFHFFASAFDIPHSMGFVAFLNSLNGSRQIGHCFPIFQGPDHFYWIWNYHSAGFGDINGPFETEEKAASEGSIYFSVLYNGLIKVARGEVSALAPRQAFYSIVSQAELERVVDRKYGHSVQQIELLAQLPSLRTFNQMVRRAGEDVKGKSIDLDLGTGEVFISEDYKLIQEAVRLKAPLALVFPRPLDDDIKRFYKVLSFNKVKSLLFDKGLTHRMRWWPHAR